MLYDRVSIQRRNRVLAQMQRRNPALKISFTLPVSPSGMPDSALYLLNDANAAGVKIAVVNIMVGGRLCMCARHTALTLTTGDGLRRVLSRHGRGGH